MWRDQGGRKKNIRRAKHGKVLGRRTGLVFDGVEVGMHGAGSSGVNVLRRRVLQKVFGARELERSRRSGSISERRGFAAIIRPVWRILS